MGVLTGLLLLLSIAAVGGGLTNKASYDIMLDQSVLVEIWKGDRRIGHGSGAILEDGRILTAGHMTQRGLYHEDRRPDSKYAHTEWRVVYADGTTTKAEVLRSDYTRRGKWINDDLALLQPKREHPKYRGSPVNCREMPVGTEVFVAGNPSILRRSLTHGRVFSTSYRSYADETFPKWLQIDAVVTGGNSGGPVYTKDLKIVGIVSHGLVTRSGYSQSPTGHNFAVPGPVICKYLNITSTSTRTPR